MAIRKLPSPTQIALRRIILGLSSASLLFSTTLTPLAAQGMGSGAPLGVVAGQMGNLYSAEELDSILAPIALYPDQLLTQILMASAFPDQVAEASGWVGAGSNRTLRGEALDRALRPIPWDPAVKSLVPFPQVLTMLASHAEWTAQLAFAVAEQEAATFDSVQRLRRQARLAGYLRSTSQQVVRTDGNVIVIVPVSPNVVYVPVYNPQVVYGDWAYPTYPPYYFPPTYSVPGNYLATGIFFGVGVAVVGSLWGWATPRWRDRHFHVDPRRYDYFRRNYRAPPGDWRRWERDQWRPPERRVDAGQSRPLPPRPSDNQFRPPVQRPAEGQTRPVPSRQGDGPTRPGVGQPGERPVPPRPDQGQRRPGPGRSDDNADRPGAPRPEQGQRRPVPGRPDDNADRPVAPRPDGQRRPGPGRPDDNADRPVAPRPEGQRRPGPGRPDDNADRPVAPRPEQGQRRPVPGRPDDNADRPVAPRPDQGQRRPMQVPPEAGQERPMPRQSPPMQRGPDNSQARPMPRQEVVPQRNNEPGGGAPAGAERGGRPAQPDRSDRPGQQRREN